MKILLVNKYLYPKGGAEKVTMSTGELLEKRGHQVLFWGMSHPKNPEYSTAPYFTDGIDYHNSGGIIDKIKVASKLLYSFEAKKKVERLILAEKPDIAHLHNFAHQLSTSILDVFKKYDIPVVMTLHDYKVVCPTYSMLCMGKPCEKCSKGKYYWCFLRKCTKGSYAKSLLNSVEMYLHHTVLNSYNKVDVFAPVSAFLKEKVAEMGLKGKLVQLPNFIDANDYEPAFASDGRSIVYFGRLSKEKGILTLIKAVEGLNVELNIIGTGPQREELEEVVSNKKMKNVHFLGFKNGNELNNLLNKSMFIVVPSEWYENYPLAIVEAFALGKPVIGARIGGIPELVKDQERGLLFTPGNAEELRKKIEELLGSSDSVVSMGKAARQFVETELNPDRHYEMLMQIYSMAMGKSKRTN